MVRLMGRELLMVRLRSPRLGLKLQDSAFIIEENWAGYGSARFIDLVKDSLDDSTRVNLN